MATSWWAMRAHPAEARAEVGRTCGRRHRVAICFVGDGTIAHKVGEIHERVPEDTGSVQNDNQRHGSWTCLQRRHSSAYRRNRLERRAQPPHVQTGRRDLGTPLGHADFVQEHLRAKNESHRILLDRIPSVPDLQAAWLILLFCASTRPNFLLPPDATRDFAHRHDSLMRSCLSTLLKAEVPEAAWDIASLPLSLGGLGLAHIAPVTRPVGRAGAIPWRWSVSAIQKSRLSWFVSCKVSDSGSTSKGLSTLARSWSTEGLPHLRGMTSPAASDQPLCPTNAHFLEATVRPRLLDASRAMLRSQSGPLASAPFTCCPTARHSTFDAQVFRTLLLRRLWLPLPSSSRVCRCGRPLDSSGHHRAACAVAGVLGSRGFAVESAAARVCREGGGRVTTNIRIQDMDIVAPNRLDERRIKILVDGLPLFHGAQIAVDTTLVSVLRRDGVPRPRCPDVDGAALEVARRTKERRYAELSGRHGRTRLVVLGAEVGGRWSQETAHFLLHLVSLLDRRAGLGSDGATPSTSDVVGECRHMGM